MGRTSDTTKIPHYSPINFTCRTSTAAGCSVGALYALGGYRLQNRATYGVEAALLASVVLAGWSIPRAIKTQKGLPVGLSVLAAFGLYNFGMAFANRTR